MGRIEIPPTSRRPPLTSVGISADLPVSFSVSPLTSKKPCEIKPLTLVLIRCLSGRPNFRRPTADGGVFSADLPLTHPIPFQGMTFGRPYRAPGHPQGLHP